MRYFLALGRIFFVLLLPGTVAGYIPFRILRSADRLNVPAISASSVVAALLAVAGALILLRCVWDFFAAGKGTLAPIDPPRFLVVRGLYRFTRNPMYNGVSPSSSVRHGSSGAILWPSMPFWCSSSSTSSSSCTRSLPLSHSSGSRIGPTGVPFLAGASRHIHSKRAPGATIGDPAIHPFADRGSITVRVSALRSSADGPTKVH